MFSGRTLWTFYQIESELDRQHNRYSGLLQNYQKALTRRPRRGRNAEAFLSGPTEIFIAGDTLQR